MSEDNEPYTVVVHYREKQFPYSFTSDIDSWDNETYLDLKRRVRQEYQLTGEFGLYEDIDGLEEVDIDDQDDLQDAFQDEISEDESYDTELTPTRKLLHLYVKDHEQLARLSWSVKSHCSVFSRSKRKWYEGHIEKILGELQDEWLVVRYDNKRKSKEIQRNSKDIKPLPLDHPLSLQKGSFCSVYSDKTFNWYKAEILDIFNDTEGEWLKVKYTEQESVQTAELQRFSSDLKSVSFLKKVYNGIGLGPTRDDKIQIVIHDVKKAENRTMDEHASVFLKPMVIDQISIAYIVSGYVRMIEERIRSYERHSAIFGTIHSIVFTVCLSYAQPCTMWMDCNDGDRILLKDGKSGIVRYVGKPEFMNKELVGIELDDRSSNANDMNMFTAPPGHSHFIDRQCPGYVVNVIGEGNYAKIIGLNKVPSFNGKIVKLATFVEKKCRWKVKLAAGVQQRKYLGVKQANLQSIPVWHQLPFEISWNLKQSLRKNPKVNDMVLTINNKYGKVMYFSGNTVGMKLSHFDVNGGDGNTVNEMSYLNVPKGYGYFADIKYLAAINPKELHHTFRVGDYVALDDTDEAKGIITFITKCIVGIEMGSTEYITTIQTVREVISRTRHGMNDLDEITQRLEEARE